MDDDKWKEKRRFKMNSKNKKNKKMGKWSKYIQKKDGTKAKPYFIVWATFPCRN